MALFSERYINCTCSLDFIHKVPKESISLAEASL